MSEKKKLICIVGPTASGKTELSVLLAKRLNGEIVSADSMQVYKGMPIASAVPSEDEKCGIKHHLLEFLSPEEQLTVADYKQYATEAINDILSRNKTPILVGGTGLYINAVINNLIFLPETDDKSLRNKLSDEYDRLGGEEMHLKLEEIDPIAAERISKNDKKRLVRALELYENLGITPTQQYSLSKTEPSPYSPVIIGLNYKQRELLYERINLRVDKMLKNGLLDEAKAFYSKGEIKKGGFYAIGHKEFFPYFDGETTLESATENLKRQTRRYAKRQITWFNKLEDVNWIYKDETDDVLFKTLKILNGRGIT